MFNTKYRNIVEKVCQQLTLQQKREKNLFCLVSGPQGSGKTTFTSEIKKKLTKKKIESFSVINR